MMDFRDFIIGVFVGIFLAVWACASVASDNKDSIENRLDRLESAVYNQQGHPCDLYEFCKEGENDE